MAFASFSNISLVSIYTPGGGGRGEGGGGKRASTPATFLEVYNIGQKGYD